ncbi:hypothetical protein [Dyella jiangningensis]|uniref:hypothetical protein n=1 Tax=Dyella jiangningensis TaxID=1379159 RepID=UPI0011BE8309|nr:hypothetical protein [Dyella jiangningensis]
MSGHRRRDACRRRHETGMGCLPLPILFLLGLLIGRAVGGTDGALWGAGIGLAVGLVLGGMFVVLVRRRR